MKTTATPSIVEKYPCLKIATIDKRIVLFTRPLIGTIVHMPSEPDRVGEQWHDWLESDFTPFTGTVTLEN